MTTGKKPNADAIDNDDAWKLGYDLCADDSPCTDRYAKRELGVRGMATDQHTVDAFVLGDHDATKADS